MQWKSSFNLKLVINDLIVAHCCTLFIVLHIFQRTKASDFSVNVFVEFEFETDLWQNFALIKFDRLSVVNSA